MTLRERLSGRPVDPAKQFCTVGRVLDQLTQRATPDDPTSEYQALVQAMVVGMWSSTNLVDALHAEAYGDVSLRHMREHRRGVHTVDNCKMPLVGLIK